MELVSKRTINILENSIKINEQTTQKFNTKGSMKKKAYLNTCLSTSGTLKSNMNNKSTFKIKEDQFISETTNFYKLVDSSLINFFSSKLK